VKVKDVMDASPECVSQATTVDSVVQSVFYQHGYRATPVCLEFYSWDFLSASRQVLSSRGRRKSVM